VVACAATAILVAVLRVSIAAKTGGLAIVTAILAWNLRRCAGRGVPAIVHVGVDRSITVTDRGGRSRAGAVLDDSYVGSALTTVVWSADGDRWWRPARTILFVRDSLPEDDFRHLRVLLRYGSPPGEAVTSGTDAGRPASQARASTRMPLSAFDCDATR